MVMRSNVAYDAELVRGDAPINNFNRLIGINIDAIKGYREAADSVENDSYKSLFHEYAQQRKTFATELANAVTSLGGTPEDDGNVKGLLHRTWTNVRTAVSDGDKALFDEIDRGEEAAIEVYNDVLESNMSETHRTMVVDQLNKIRQAHNKIESIHAQLS